MKKIVSIVCVILLGISLSFHSYSFAAAENQAQALKNMQAKDVLLRSVKGKPKHTYYKTTFNNADYGKDYEFYKKNKIGLCWAVYFGGNTLYFHGSMLKSNTKNFSSGKTVYLHKKNRSFITTSKTKYYTVGDEPQKRITRRKFSSFLAKANKGLLSFGIILTKENNRAVKIIITN